MKIFIEGQRGGGGVCVQNMIPHPCRHFEWRCDLFARGTINQIKAIAQSNDVMGDTGFSNDFLIGHHGQ